MAHKFGGIWTQKKLEVLESYLQFYSQALKNQPFTLHYADAFAGTGTHVPDLDEQGDQLIPMDELRGSVVTALNVVPGFGKYHFNDLNSEHARELRRIQAEFPERNINVYEMDANFFVPEFCRNLGPNDRAVLLLDPYSTQLNWATIEYAARSQKVDVWLLFPISAVLRMTPTGGVKEEWVKKLNLLLGTNLWQDALYKQVDLPPIDDLFGTEHSESPKERVNPKALESWVTDRLNTIFGAVAPPLWLKRNGSPLFLFYFAISSKNPKAIGLAKRVASQILKKHGS